MTNDQDKYLDLGKIHKQYEYSLPYQKIGKIKSSKGLVYEVALPKAILGANVEFVTEFSDRCFGEVVGLNSNYCHVMPYDDISGINSETRVYLRDLTTQIKVGPELLGRVIDFQGNPIDGKGPINATAEKRDIFGRSLNPLQRPPIRQKLSVGINSIDAFITAGRGQRMAIMAGSGVGKSVLMGMMAKNTEADINVIALIGERGREVLEFIESDLGEEGLKRSVVVVATSDTSALIRMKAAYVATTIAEYSLDDGFYHSFRDGQ